MTNEAPRRYYFGDFALTYTSKGWALLHKEGGMVGTNLHPEGLQSPYKNGQSLLEFVEDALAKGLGDPL